MCSFVLVDPDREGEAGAALRLWRLLSLGRPPARDGPSVDLPERLRRFDLQVELELEFCSCEVEGDIGCEDATEDGIEDRLAGALPLGSADPFAETFALLSKIMSRSEEGVATADDGWDVKGDVGKACSALVAM